MERNLISIILVKSLLFVSFISLANCTTIRSATSCPSPCNCSVDTYSNANLNFSIVLEIECPAEAKNVDLHEFFLARSRVWDATKFDSVHIKRLPNSELKENFFGSFKFRYLRIAESNISMIHPDAFRSTINLTEFNLINCTFSERLENGSELFNAINRFKNLRIFRISRSNLKKVMSDAFSPSLGKLAIVRLDNNEITEFGDRAVYHLYNLTWLDLAGNRLREINNETFLLPSVTDKPLQIDLDNNALTGHSFKEGSFSNVNRPIVLLLRSNKIEFLPEKVFLPLLKSSSFRVFPSKNKFICDCNNRWILVEKYLSSLAHDEIICEDGTSIWSKDLQDFNYCDLTVNDVKDSLMDLVDFMSKLKLLSTAHEKHILSLVKNRTDINRRFGFSIPI
ncbi:uncharacterized protein LOC141851874 [Brevipalpus obovatus]|uniref:uncharacterized protein LOC141851874 n=1 Tax=Brevipalpus obovatus TaxID=246614 RepID=UPI003D9DF8BA